MDTCNNMDKYQNHYTESKKLNTKENIMYECIYIKFQKMQSNIVQMGLWERQTAGVQETFQGDGNFLYLDCGGCFITNIINQ